MSFFTKYLAKNKGFTLVELMVTVAIIALLTGIITANFTSARSKSRDAKRISDMAQLQLALENFFDRCNRYPRLDTAVTPNMPLLTDSGNGCPTGITLSTFISAIPKAQTPGAYTYDVNSNGDGTGTPPPPPPTDYVLGATLENQNSVLTDSFHGNTFTNSNGTTVQCSGTLTYCVIPR